jgi:hypothetical protein
MANPLGLSAALVSRDGFLLLGKRNSKVAYYPNRIHAFAGSATDADLFAEMRRELNEELGMTDADITEIRCIGLAEDISIGQPELIFSVVTQKTRREIEASLDKSEHVAVVEACGDQSQWTPIAQATVSLWEAHRAGKSQESPRRK